MTSLENKKILQRFFSPKMLSLLLLGYSAGLPLLLTGSTLQAWMVDEGIDLGAIGLFSLLGTPYTLKFLWAPFLDRYQLPIFSRRKGWMILFQGFICLSIYGLSWTSPRESFFLFCFWAFLISFFSASLDIVLDAYRREILSDEELGAGASFFIMGYRLAMLVSGALALYLADHMEWKSVFGQLTLFMAPSLLFTLLAPKESKDIYIPQTLAVAVVGPVKDFFSRPGAGAILLFMLLYKVGDSMAASMTTPFILKMGYSKTDLASVAKTFGMVATIFGGLLGGAMMLKIPMKKALLAFGILQAVSTLGFSVLANLPVSFFYLSAVIFFENLAGGMGTAAYSAYMAHQTNKQFTGTQYALLSAIMGIPRVILSSPTGVMAKSLGWEIFFLFCTLMAVPGLVLLWKIFQSERPDHRTTLK